MNSFDKILYLCDLFIKNAQAVTSYKYNHSEKDLDSVHGMFYFLIGKDVPIYDIDYWISQNNNLLIDYDIKFNNMIKDNIIKIVYSPKYINGKRIYNIISANNDFENNIEYDIIKSGFLKGYRNIPNLYIFTASESEFDREPISKQLSHYAFLEKALIDIGTMQIDENIKPDLTKNKAIELFPQFLNKNKEKIDKLMSSFSYYPKYLGGGIDGSAFDIGENSILKIFRESFAYYKAKEAYERLHKNPELATNEAMIYDVGILGSFGSQTVYYYIMEKMKPLDNHLTPDMTKIVGYIGEYIKYEQDLINPYRKLINNKENNNKITEFLNNNSYILEKLLYNEHSKEIYNMETLEPSLQKDWVKSLCQEILFKYITGRADLHLSNLGLTNYGKFVYFDPSYGEWENAKRIINTPSRDSMDFADIHGKESEMFI